MKTLANGKSQKTILKLLRILINVSQSNFGDLDLDDGCIRDIADVITADTPNGSGEVDRAAPREDSANLYPRGAIVSALPNDLLNDAVQYAVKIENREEVLRKSVSKKTQSIVA